MSTKDLYISTLSKGPNHGELDNFIQSQLKSLESEQLCLPETYNPKDLENRLHKNYKSILKRYDDYLQRRRAGAPRELFANKAAAYYYLECAYPTKLVDGSWLYSTFKKRDRNIYTILQKIFIEEAGEGQLHLNHVYIYKSLMERYSLNQNLNLVQDPFFTQGAIQLALGYSSGDLLPEIVGYNLCYEQLPYDLLVINCELDELGIDPYYFTLHITIDNSNNGHAKNAVDAVIQLLESCADDASKAEMYQRVRRGYSLNYLGPDIYEIIEGFSATQELCKCISNKSPQTVGIHTKSVKIGSRTLNEWLDPELCQDLRHVESFLEGLCESGYIRKGKPADQSKFWQIISANTCGVMYGVFSEKEKQLFKLYIEEGQVERRNSSDVVGRQEQEACENNRNDVIEGLIDKYLGPALSQHKHVQLPDPETGDYKSLAELYITNRKEFLRCFERYSIRRATFDSFCWGRMKKVMPEKDKQILIKWLGVHDPMSTTSSIEHNNTIPVGIDEISSSLTVSSEKELVTFLNTLLCVIAKYLDPREHYTERGIIMTWVYDLTSRHTSLGTIDENIEAILQPLDYWTLLGVCLYTIQSTSLKNKCEEMTKFIAERFTLQEDKERVEKNIKLASKQISFNIVNEYRTSRNDSVNRNLLLTKGLKSFYVRDWQDSVSLILTLLGLFMILHVFGTVTYSSP